MKLLFTTLDFILENKTNRKTKVDFSFVFPILFELFVEQLLFSVVFSCYDVINFFEFVTYSNKRIRLEVFVAWKRGKKKVNQGHTESAPVINNKVTFNASVSLRATLYKDQKGNFEPKYIAFSLKEVSLLLLLQIHNFQILFTFYKRTLTLILQYDLLFRKKRRKQLVR